MVDVVRVEYRKGMGNKEFEKIVGEIVDSLKQVDRNAKTFDRALLNRLRERDAGYFNQTDYSIFKKYGFQVDIYHPEEKIAIEVEKSETKLVWKILCKFSIGAKRGLIRYAVLIVPMEYWGRNKKSPTKIFRDAVIASKFMGQILWTKNLAIIGYRK